MRTDEAGLVLFLGAGFSKSMDDRMPLNKDLLSMMKNRLSSELRNAIEFIFPQDTWSHNIEDLLAILHYLRIEQKKRPCLQSLKDPERIWRELIEQIERVTHFKAPYKKEQWDAHEKLGPLINFLHEHKTDDRISIITTNYDLIADKAALAINDEILKEYGNEEPSRSDLRRYQYGYPIRKLYSQNRTGNEVQNHEPWAVLREPSISVYKLHGSMNWLYCSYCKELDLARTFDDLPWNVDKWPACSNCESPYDPLIIPPVPNKQTADNPVLQKVWRKAEKAVETAGLVIFVGYSFPQADPLVLQLVTTARLRSRAINGQSWNFGVIDPSPNVHERYREIFGFCGRHYYSTFNISILSDCLVVEGAPFINTISH